ncbi:MAG: hypothetical protein PHY47_27425 [Lachnospiraceae bacterium]|nr:hypothetical protein [Lachnospiraceae bacterium]
MNENTLEFKKTIVAPDTTEVSQLLESLDSNSRLLARTYLSALADRQQLEKLELVPQRA